MHLVYCLKHGDGQYAAISGYLEHRTHLDVFTKSQKFVLQRSCKNYKLVKGKLYYKEQIQDGLDLDCLAVKKSKTDRVFLSVTSLQEDTEGGMLL